MAQLLPFDSIRQHEQVRQLLIYYIRILLGSYSRGVSAWLSRQQQAARSSSSSSSKRCILGASHAMRVPGDWVPAQASGRHARCAAAPCAAAAAAAGAGQHTLFLKYRGAKKKFALARSRPCRQPTRCSYLPAARLLAMHADARTRLLVFFSHS